MNLKRLSCLLVVSTMFSLQAFKVVNETSYTIRLHQFAQDDIAPFGGVVDDYGIPYYSAIVVKPYTFRDTIDLYRIITAMTVTIDNISYKFDQLTNDTVIKFYQNEKGGIEYIRT